MIGDADPEDAYDAADPPAQRLAVLRSAVTSIVVESAGDRSSARRTWVHSALDHLSNERDASVDPIEINRLRTILGSS